MANTRIQRYTKEDKAKTIFEDLIINLEEVFEDDNK
jgi:hypothetical protein